MLKFIHRILEDRKWRYLGRVEAETVLVDADGEAIPGGKKIAVWNLFETNSGRRRADKTGNHGGAPDAVRTASSVQRWVKGGPLPSEIDTTGHFKPPLGGGDKVIPFNRPAA